MNDQYSFDDFLQQQFADRPAAEFAGEIVGSCFQQDEPNTGVFPPDAKATFLRCNLGNCVIPAGCTVGDGCNAEQYAKQNDGESWVLDKDGKPIRPLKLKAFRFYGLSEDPRDIPAEPRKVPLLKQKRWEDRKIKGVARLDAKRAALIAQTEPEAVRVL